MAKDFDKIYLSDQGVKERFEFLRDCFGFKTRSKFLGYLTTEHMEMKGRIEELKKENEILKMRVKLLDVK